MVAGSAHIAPGGEWQRGNASYRAAVLFECSLSFPQDFRRDNKLQILSYRLLFVAHLSAGDYRELTVPRPVSRRWVARGWLVHPAGDASYAGAWELPVPGAVTAPGAVLGLSWN